ncbi:MAG TPA: hypothetical protein VE548_14955 [Nitrososphaeraceae archaeon]|nr:hypothetical protein [Nitrososphaeraceae archaeon]
MSRLYYCYEPVVGVDLPIKALLTCGIGVVVTLTAIWSSDDLLLVISVPLLFVLLNNISPGDIPNCAYAFRYSTTHMFKISGSIKDIDATAKYIFINYRK